MYEVTNVFQRRDRKTPFFSAANKANKALNDAYSAAEAAADGYRGRSDDLSRNDKRYTATISWRDQEAAERFGNDAAVTFAEFLAARAAYYAANGIRHQVFNSYVSDADPPQP
jgi:hypothetical protein